MGVKEYNGKVLRVSYPDFLRVKTHEPQWSAFAPEDRAAVVIEVNPQPVKADAFARLVRDLHFPRALIQREGQFTTAKGIDGYERLALHSETVAWDIDAKFRSRYTLNIGIWATRADWHDGTVWEDLVNTIEVIGDPAGQDAARSQPVGTYAQRKAPITTQRPANRSGILLELPEDLGYLLEIANTLNSFPSEQLQNEDNPEPFRVLELGLEKGVGPLTSAKARARIKADHERLWSWLREHPVKKFPETARLYFVVGGILNGGFIDYK
ncbi:hypothetical protein SBV1_310030 [Verrucomicrobia bacterium]|nr:hypothetical protein SBV1_310030 [Verrucomicrobiota bacterium]